MLDKIKEIRNNSVCMLESIKIECGETSKNSKTRSNHRIQKSTYLQKIAVNKKAWHFNIYSDNYKHTKGKLVLNSIKSIHIHPMLCGKHDKDIFNAIENGNAYEEDNELQNFQFAFRAYIFDFYEYCLKMTNKNSNKWVEKRGEFAHLEMIKLFEKFRDCYMNDKYDVLDTTLLKLDKEVGFVSCTKINPLIDMKGKYRWQSELAGCYLNIFPQNGVTYILISHFKENKKYCRKLINQLKECEEKRKYKEIETYLNKVVASHDMNLVISPRIYENWSQEAKQNFYEYAHLIRKAKKLTDTFGIYKKMRKSDPQFDLFSNS
ncbi:hypothetical protein AB9M62_34080 [Bacillales bacterium AN1005]